MHGKRKIALGFLAGFLASCLFGAVQPRPLHFPPTEGTHQVAVFKVTDGDTVHFFWLIPDVARLHGINAPELKGATKPAGEASRKFLEEQLAQQPQLTARSIVAEVKGREKYGRALLRFWTTDGKDLSDASIKAGHAKPYNP